MPRLTSLATEGRIATAASLRFATANPQAPVSQKDCDVSSTSKHAGAPGTRKTTREIKSPALLLALALALGIILSVWLSGSSGSSPPAAIVLRQVPRLIAAAAACLLGAGFLIRTGRNGSAAALLLAGFVVAGAALPILFACRFPPNHLSRLNGWVANFDGLDRPAEIEGSVLTEPIPTPSGLEFDLAATTLSETGFSPAYPGARPARPVSGKVRVRLESFTGPDAGSEEQNSSEGQGRSPLHDALNLHVG
jgi:Domain of unknown function (DUF4131)